MTEPASPQLNFTPQVLFPDISDANTNPICIVIAKLFQEINQKKPVFLNQEDVTEAALEHYYFLNISQKLSISHASFTALHILRQGASTTTVKEYFHFRLAPEDAQRWRI